MPRHLLVNIDVPSLEAGIAFYQAGLGFDFRRRLFGGTVAELALGAVHLYLVRCEPGTAAVPGGGAVRDYADHWTPVHLDVVVDDLPAAIERAVAAGARPVREATRHAWGDLAPMRDPFGHGFCLIAHRGDGYDAVAEG